MSLADPAVVPGSTGDFELRDEVERLIRSWDAHEVARGAQPIIDYDCAPTDDPVTPADSRLDILERLTGLHPAAQRDRHLGPVVTAHIAYLSALLGERPDLDTYLRQTQGCPAGGWPEEYVTAVGERVHTSLAEHGIDWGPSTDRDLTAVEEPIDIREAEDRIQDIAAAAEPAIRALTGSQAVYTLRVEVQDVDDYWSFWLDGAGSQVRLRFNTRQATFTRNRLHQFALHEILGHALQSASLAETCTREDVPWVRLLSVNLPYQVMLEGLAQAMPLFIARHHTLLTTRVRLDHYLQLVRAELHQAINAGHPVADCAAHARARVPYWSGAQIADALSDRGKEPLLRSYLWAYPAGIDWWINLADSTDAAHGQEAADSHRAGSVLRAAYQRPLTPTDLAELWPTGPRIGGPGAPVRLRKPALP